MREYVHRVRLAGVSITLWPRSGNAPERAGFGALFD